MVPRRFTVLMTLVYGTTNLLAQSLGSVDQIQSAVGDRIEALTILGGDRGIGGGVYSIRGDVDVDLNLFKFGGDGEVGRYRSLGIGSILWRPLIEGNIGVASTENELLDPPLEGNEIDFDTYALQLGLGSRFYFNTNVSVALSVAGIVGHTENEFTANTPEGRELKDLYGGTLVDWKVDTWSVVPAVSIRYAWWWHRTEFRLESRFRYLYTSSFGSTSRLVAVDGHSQIWQNLIDVDVPLGWHILGQELHTGGFLSWSDLSGDFRRGFGLNHVFTLNGRVVLDFTDKLWIVKWLGVGSSFYWAEDFRGWAVGADLRFDF